MKKPYREMQEAVSALYAFVDEGRPEGCVPIESVSDPVIDTVTAACSTTRDARDYISRLAEDCARMSSHDLLCGNQPPLSSNIIDYVCRIKHNDSILTRLVNHCKQRQKTVAAPNKDQLEIK